MSGVPKEEWHRFSHCGGVQAIPVRRNDAMQQFVEKHRGDIIGVLSGWDRIRFRGTIRELAYVSGMMSWRWDRQVLLKNFKCFARDLAAYRACEANPTGAKRWRRLRKGVVDLPCRAAISQAITGRYLAALAEVEARTASAEKLAKLAT
jgi:hypothetical protein